jgi:parallel beta-helix repeat protein
MTSYFTKYSTMKNHLLTLTALFLLQNYIFSQTDVPAGSVSGTWTHEGSPYNVQGDIMIDDGTVLVINPGVTVNFAGMQSLTVAGRLLAIGNETDSIIFTTADLSNGWQGIRFDHTPETNDTSMIMYCSIKYGKATGASPFNKGGAIYFSHFSNAFISNSLIAFCSSVMFGGAIYCESSSPVISYNTITKNTTSAGGGGIYFGTSSSPVISHNTISYNVSTLNGGGGIFGSGGNAIISDNVITHNEVSNPTEGGGGGIYINGDQIVITRNTITYNNTNTLSGGGGIFCTESKPVIFYNTISNNEAHGSAGGGGGISLTGGASPVISNNTIINNRTLSALGGGGGLYINSGNPAINSNTIANNDSYSGGGLFFTGGANPILLNCIVWGNEAGTSGHQVSLDDEPSDPSFMYCDVQGGSAAFGLNGSSYIGTYQNNLDIDPLFYSPSVGSGIDYDGTLADWSLGCSSSCINAGYPDGVYASVDKAGNSRVNDSRIDLGPYEFQIVAGLVFSVSMDTLIMSPIANSLQSFQINSNVSWTASDNQSWLTLDKVSGPCNATVTASVEENPAAQTRMAIITVSGTGATDQLITVIQEAPAIEVSADTMTIAAPNLSSATFNITSNTIWTLTSNQSWLTVSKLDGSGNSEINLTAERNPDNTVRTATVTVSGTGVTDHIIVVNQSGSTSVLAVSVHSLSLAAAANSIKKFNIISNIRWNIRSDKTWLNVNPSDSSGNAEITVSADANPEVTGRTAVVTVSGTDVPDQVINVTQTADEPYLSVSTNTLTIAAPANSTQTFNIMSNISWNVTTDQPWLITNTTLGADSSTITLTAEANPAGTERTATIFVAGNNVESQLLTITQEALVTGINDISPSDKILVYPNPTAGQLTISLDESLQDEYLIEVLNDLGDVVLMTKQPKDTKTAQIDLSGYSSGLYLIRISSKTENYRTWVSRK